MTSFGGSLNIGTSAIHAAQRGLDVTGQNIANSATEGYTRQRVDLESIGGPGVPAFWSRYDGVGEGVKISGVVRMNDEFLEARARASNASLGDAEENVKTMAAIERTFGEPSTTGLQSKMADFWNAWGKVGNDPKGEAPRNLVYERAGEVVSQLNRMSLSLSTQWEDTATELNANVTDINTMAKDVARLNNAIRSNNIAKVPANELLDQRDLLIKKIATLTGATVKPAEVDKNADFNSQAVDVYIGGKKLVDGVNANTITVSDANGGRYPATGNPQAVSLTWASGDPVAVGTGRVAGQLTALNTTIGDYMGQIDQIAASFASTVNAQQASGFAFTMAGGQVTSSARGTDLFTAQGGGAVTAASITLAPGSSRDSLATSARDPRDASLASLDGDNALAMAKHLSDVSGPDASYRSLVVQLGTQTQSVNRQVEVQRNVVKQAEDARDNVAGVSLNEEMTSLVRYQHSFSAAAKFIGVIDQTLETLINMTR